MRNLIKIRNFGMAALLLSLAFALCAAPASAAFQDDPADPDADGFSNGEEQLMGTNPAAFDANVNDIQLLTLLQKRAFDFFWLESKPPFFFAPDRGHFDQVGQGSLAKSIAATGFSLTSMVVADSNGWVDHLAAYNRVRTILARLRQMQQSSDPNLSKHGFFYHFTDDNGARFTQLGFDSELSTIDHALLLAGVMLAGEYYKGTEAAALAKELVDNTEWEFMFDGQFFYQAWFVDGGPVEGGSYSLNARWDRYSELMILLLQGMGSSTHPVSAQQWNDFDRGTVTYKQFPAYVHCGALFAHQFSHMWVDFRRKRDVKGINYHENSVIASLVNRQFTIDLNAADPGRYETYGQDSWGLSSADSSVGYIVLQPDFFLPEMVEFNTDSGTVVPDAAISSMPFTPAESIGAAKNWFTNFRSNTFGRYGFRNAFNFGRPNNPAALSHFPSGKIALDCGTVVGGIENFRTGMIWKFFSRNTDIQTGMNRAGFVSDALPFAMNFDNQPTPGSDPNSFGGFSGSFGPGASSSYPSLPQFNPTVGGFAWRIESSGDGGAFNTLAGQDISRFDTLSFWIKGQTGGEQVFVAIKDLSNTEHAVRVNDFIEGGQITTEFKGVRIPLRVFTDQHVRLTTMDNISFHFAGAPGGTVFVDDIAFLPDEFKPQAPSNFQAVVAGSDVDLSWNRNTEPDVVGYNVYRAANASGPFTKLNTFLVMDGLFRDNGALADPEAVFHYKVTAVDNALIPNESAFSQELVVPNLGPQLDPIGNKTVVQENLLAFTVSASDPNSDNLIFSASQLPPGASFDPQTKIFSWSPTAQQVGIFPGIRFTVTDGTFSSFEDITIVVTDNAIGTLDVRVRDIATDQIVAGIAFGTVGAHAGFTTGTQVVEIAAFSALNNWKVQIYTDNANNVHPFTGTGNAGGLIGQTSAAFRVPLKWTIFPAKVPQGGLPNNPIQWAFVQDKRDGDFGSTQDGRVFLDASGNLGNFPSAGRTVADAAAFLYLAADFTGVPAQSYTTNQLNLEMFQQ